MFLGNLSAAVLRLCNSRKLSYEAASKQCKLSARYFGDIARGKTAPTILTLEKLCIGFDLTPNDLLLTASSIRREVSFRAPMRVSQVQYCRCAFGGYTCFPVCPRCEVSIEREYQRFCDYCGQRLDWEDFANPATILPEG